MNAIILMPYSSYGDKDLRIDFENIPYVTIILPICWHMYHFLEEMIFV
jgi:hypothetical protein